MKFDKTKLKVKDSWERVDLKSAPKNIKPIISVLKDLQDKGYAEQITLEKQAEDDYVIKAQVPYKDLSSEIKPKLQELGYAITGNDEDEVNEYYYFSKKKKTKTSDSHIRSLCKTIRRVKDDSKSEAEKKLLKMIIEDSSKVEDAEDNPQRFEYMLLSRLQTDCDYYLGNGNRSPRALWAGDEKKQIEKMRELYNSLKVKPEWITMEDIDNYAKEMGVE